MYKNLKLFIDLLISHNQLVKFNSKDFDKLNSLVTLDLSYNLIITLDLKNESLIKSISQKCFVGLNNLMDLNVTKNSILFVSANEFQGCLKLDILNSS